MTTEEIIWIIPTATVLIPLSILIIMIYLAGQFSYKDEIYSSKKYKVTENNHLFGITTTEQYVERIVIKRTYDSGKIKFITKEVKI
ncbi:MAG: hypothetical protein RL728_1075 [Bacteroidota bacterium]|jgi:hypothetical protein